jgi:ubiquitin carboxyl-terminal hydrolase 8
MGHLKYTSHLLAIEKQTHKSQKHTSKRVQSHIRGPATKLFNESKYKPKQKLPGLCGLNNIGNTCFMNSALQCLSNIPDLTQWALEQNSSWKTNNVTEAYISLMKTMWSGDNYFCTPRDIKYQVSRSAPIFCDYAQKDSHEFMNSLLNTMHSELTQDYSPDSQQSIVTKLFQIKTKSQVTCQICNIPDETEEVTFCLPLPLADGDESSSLDDALTDFMKEDVLDGDYYCSVCSGLVMAKQKTCISNQLPPVIIIQLKRFTFDDTNDKINRFIRYPLVNWSPLNTLDGPFYNLAAVSMHVGNLRGGHYTTFARLNSNGQWYHFNDSSFEEVDDIIDIITRNAYLLIYLRNE